MGLCTIGRLLVLASLATAGCQTDKKGRPDSELGNLVISPIAEAPKIDIKEASQDGQLLLQAVRLPHSWVSDTIGAHVVTTTSSVVVREGGEIQEELHNTLRIEIDGEGRYLATDDNSKEYGRHAIYDGDRLYLRPRFGRYHSRLPNDDLEAIAIRSEMFAVAGDYLEILGSRLEVSARDGKSRDGRAVQEIALKLSPEVNEDQIESLPQRQWRNSLEVKSISGLVALDRDSGTPLHVQFEGVVGFERDKRQFEMSVSVDQSIGEIGHTRQVSAPEKEMTMVIPPRRHELEERDSLLKSIAPPARRAPTPAPPKAPSPGSGT